MTNVGAHGQTDYFGGQPSSVAMRTVQKDSSRSGWLSFNIPANAQGGSVHQFGVRAHLETNGDWFPTAHNVVRFTLPAVATTTQAISVTPSTGRVGENVTLSTRVSANHGTNTPTGTVRFNVDGQTLTANVVNGVATTTTSFSTTGSKSVTATYIPANSSQWNGSSRSGTVSIQSEATQTNLDLSDVEIIAGDTVRATANVTPADATGDVVFTVGDQTETVPVVGGTATTELTLTDLGRATVNAQFVPADNQRYTTSSDTETVTVGNIATDTDLDVAPTVARVGEQATLTATVTPTDVPGTVTFAVDGAEYPVEVENGVAVATHTFTEQGDFSVEATFTPTDSVRYATSTATGTAQVESEATQTDLTLDATQVIAGDTIVATASVTPATAEGQVEFTVGGQTDTVTLADGTATAEFTLDTAGEATVTATFIPANPDRFTTSEDTATVTVSEQISTNTTVEISANPRVDEAATLTARVSPANAAGTVTFTVDGTEYPATVIDGVATATHTFTAQGEYPVTADFAPTNTDRYSGSSDQATVNVEAETTATDLTLDPIEVTAGGTIVATASVTPADAEGQVQFTVGGQTDTVTLANGTATAEFTLDTAGEATVTATFIPADDQRYTTSSDTETVNVQVEQTQTTLTVDTDPVRVGQETTLTATVSPAGAEGTVTFTVDGTEYPATVIDGVATATHTFTAQGEYPVTADFAPTNTDRYSGSSDQATVNVEAETTATDLTLDPIEVTAGGTIVATASVTPADAEGQVQFTVGGQTDTVTLANGTATAEFTLDTAGEATVTATFIPADDQRYTTSSDTETVNVQVEQTQTTLTVDTDPVRVGQETTLTATVSPAGAEGTVTFTVDGTEYPATVIDGVATATHTFTAQGEYPVTADFAPTNTDRYSGSSDQATVNVEAETTATDLTLDPVEVTAGGTIVATASVTPADAEGQVQFTVGGQTDTVTLANGTATAEFTLDTAGEATVTATFIPADDQRYTTSSDTETVNVQVEQTQTTLTLAPAEVTVGGTITATAQVTPAEAAGQVRFEYAGQSDTVGVADGVATAEFTVATAGNNTVTATFIPSEADRYSGSSDTRSVTADAVATQTELSLDATEVTVGETVTATASVTPAGVAGNVEFVAGGTPISVPVNAEGVATAELPATAAGELTVTATFIPTDAGRYNGSSDTRTVQVESDVEAVPTTVELDAGTAEPGREVTITARVTPADAQGQVRFTVNGVARTVPVVNGVATLVHVAGEQGEYTVLAEFLPADPGAYAPGEATETLIVDEDADPGTDPQEPSTGSLSIIGLFGSLGLALHSSGSLGSLGS
nr:Ig-like domain repeat protein [Dietzia sp. oral taxon 368]